MERLREKEKKLLSPRNFFDGKRLPENFAMPDNIIMFFHDFPSTRNMIHQRYTLVIPHGKMNYILDSVPISIQTGDALLIFPGQERSQVEDSQCYSRLFITFDLEGTQEYIPNGNLGQFGEESIDILCRAVDFYHTGQMIQCSMELVKFFLSLKNVIPKSRRKHLHPVIAKALSLLNSDISHHRKVNIKKLAEKLNISESQLRLLFRRATGTCISNYTAEENLKTAQYHLIYSNKSIAEIAELCGYGSVYSFSAFFKKKTGESPREFRNKNRSNG